MALRFAMWAEFDLREIQERCHVFDQISIEGGILLNAHIMATELQSYIYTPGSTGGMMRFLANCVVLL
jgi:hypothetical protein